MLLKSIRLRNFRQFKGEQTITFSCDPERNVTVILGDNTSGKTTLVQAFIWALYGVTNFPTEDLLNVHVAKQMHVGDEETVEVEICLNHDNTDYVIRRSEVYVCTNKDVRRRPSTLPQLWYKGEDGQIEPIREPVRINSTIQRILPKELSSYFFFDGERINTISRQQDVTEAVQGLLGLTVLSNAMAHLNPRSTRSVIGKLRSSLDVNSSQRAEQIVNQIDQYTERRDNITKQIDDLKQQITYYQEQIEETENFLREHQPTAALQRKRDELERNIRAEERALEEAKNRFVERFNKNAAAFFARPMMKMALESLKQTEVSDKGIPGMNAAAIDYIISRGVCICGEGIREGSSHHAHLIRERDFLPPQSIGAMLRTFQDQIKLYETLWDPYYDNLKAAHSEFRRCKDRINTWYEELSELSKQIKGREDVIKHEEKLQDYRSRLNRLLSTKEKLIEESGKLANEIERLQHHWDSLAVVSEKNRKIQLYIRYAEAIHEWIKETYEYRQQELRKQLEERVNRIFAQMYHGRRKVSINERFRVTLWTSVDKDEMVTDESRGLETVKNFAFIAGLVDLAREKIKERTGGLEMALSSEPYPLVMDAPFSNADEKHVSNISRVLPDIAEQVIMVVMAKDWGFAEPVMGYRVGKKYYLDKRSETLTYIRESV